MSRMKCCTMLSLKLYKERGTQSWGHATERWTMGKAWLCNEGTNGKPTELSTNSCIQWLAYACARRQLDVNAHNIPSRFDTVHLVQLLDRKSKQITIKDWKISNVLMSGKQYVLHPKWKMRVVSREFVLFVSITSLSSAAKYSPENMNVVRTRTRSFVSYHLPVVQTA